MTRRISKMKPVENKLMQLYLQGYDEGSCDTLIMVNDVIKDHKKEDPKEILKAIQVLCKNALENKANK